ncbi:MAG: prolipoprotein diacylglyceryl transferase, partial [Candidatus Omnitrophica bacterium]|nr:prolipoprotein diacylglyceryl transferase [Candidatus Omnitrophota bacterium]
MFPVICKIGPVSVYSYGFMLAIAVMTSGWLVARQANAKLGVRKDDVYDLAFWVVLAGILGARIFY